MAISPGPPPPPNDSDTTPVAGSHTKHLTTWRLATVISSLCVGSFLFGIDVNIISVAIPPITTEFRSLPEVAWYGAAYLLTLTAFQPFFGNLYRFFDAKIVYLVSLVLFEGGYLVWFFPSLSVLIGARLLIFRACSWVGDLCCRADVCCADLWSGFPGIGGCGLVAGCVGYHWVCCRC